MSLPQLMMMVMMIMMMTTTTKMMMMMMIQTGSASQTCFDPPGILQVYKAYNEKSFF